MKMAKWKSLGFLAVLGFVGFAGFLVTAAMASDTAGDKNPGQMPADVVSGKCQTVADQVVPLPPPVTDGKTGETKSGQGK